MLVNRFGELRSSGGSLVMVLCTCNERHDEVIGTQCYAGMTRLLDFVNTQQWVNLAVVATLKYRFNI